MQVVISQVCWDCEVEKPASEFGVVRRNPSGINSMCKSCNARRAKKIRDAKPKVERFVKIDCDFLGCDKPHSSRGYCRTHAKQDRDGKVLKPIGCTSPQTIGISHAEARRIRCATNKARVDRIKLETGCVDCGYNTHAEAMDLDHLPGFEKHKAVSSMMAKSWSRIEAEIAKCEVVCANCHRVRTANRRNKEKQ